MFPRFSHINSNSTAMEERMSHRNLIIGTCILAAANFLTKCMGFFYRVFMANTIGAEGMGLYQLILPLYSLI